MWVFGYGSLMSDSWERDFACQHKERATLAGYRRDFNKRSVSNWGTSRSPCPTLGLAEDDGAECVGVAFQFPDEQRDALCAYLSHREGPSFSLPEKQIRLDSGSVVEAVVPINDRTASTYVGDLTVADRAKLVKTAQGTEGTCLEYVSKVRKHLTELGVTDPSVEAFWTEVTQT